MEGINANDKIYKMSFSKVYPLLVTKCEKKGRTREEVNAPQLNPNRKLITGKICGVCVEEIEEPLMQEIRYLDKLIDELAKGKPMEKILRK